MKLLFCVEAERGFETGSTRCEISVGCCRQRHPVGAVIAVRLRCEAFAQRLARKDELAKTSYGLVSSRKASEAAGVELSPPMFGDGNRFHTGRYTRRVPRALGFAGLPV